MKSKLGLFLSALVLGLAGCGGSGDEYNSSFTGTVTLGSTVYTCKTQKAFDACSSNTNRDCSACTSNVTDTTAITAVCAQPSTNNFNVTQSGCVLKLKGGDSTGVCTGQALKVLNGSGLTKTKVVDEGVLFSNPTTLNGQTIRCIN